jgi:hypothetical protein
MPAPRYVRPGSARAGFSTRSLLVEAVLACLIAGLLIAPQVLEGRTALAWTRYHAAQAPLARRPGEHTRQAGHWAAQAVELLAPLPQGAEAARLALGLGQAIEPRDHTAALTLYTQVRAALERVRASRGRGLGLGGLAAEAGRLAEAAREGAPDDQP